jgi:hypothetical protein
MKRTMISCLIALWMILICSGNAWAPTQDQQGGDPASQEQQPSGEAVNSSSQQGQPSGQPKSVMDKTYKSLGIDDESLEKDTGLNKKELKEAEEVAEDVFLY